MKRILFVLAVVAASFVGASSAQAGNYYHRHTVAYSYVPQPVYVVPVYSYGVVPYGYNYGIIRYGVPAHSFANPAAYGFGPGAIFGW